MFITRNVHQKSYSDQEVETLDSLKSLYRRLLHCEPPPSWILDEGDRPRYHFNMESYREVLLALSKNVRPENKKSLLSDAIKIVAHVISYLSFRDASMSDSVKMNGVISLFFDEIILSAKQLEGLPHDEEAIIQIKKYLNYLEAAGNMLPGFNEGWMSDKYSSKETLSQIKRYFQDVLNKISLLPAARVGSMPFMPLSIDNLLRRGFNFEQQSKPAYEGAMAVYLQALDIARNDYERANINACIGYCYLQQGDREAARSFFEQAVNTKTCASLFAQANLYYLDGRRNNQAEVLLREAATDGFSRAQLQLEQDVLLDRPSALADVSEFKSIDEDSLSRVGLFGASQEEKSQPIVFNTPRGGPSLSKKM